MMGKSQQQEVKEAAGSTASSVKKQSAVTAYTQLAFSFLYSLGLSTQGMVHAHRPGLLDNLLMESSLSGKSELAYVRCQVTVKDNWSTITSGFLFTFIFLASTYLLL